MCGQQSGHKRHWRDYHTASGARPIRDFLLALPDEGRAAILEEMEYVRQHGTSVARHVRKGIYEVRATYDTKAYRILLAGTGQIHRKVKEWTQLSLLRRDTEIYVRTPRT